MVALRNGPTQRIYILNQHHLITARRFLCALPRGGRGRRLSISLLRFPPRYRRWNPRRIEPKCAVQEWCAASDEKYNGERDVNNESIYIYSPTNKTVANQPSLPSHCQNEYSRRLSFFVFQDGNYDFTFTSAPVDPNASTTSSVSSCGLW